MWRSARRIKREIEHFLPYDRMVYTGPIDEFFDYRFGRLPYRSLEFKHETHDVPIFQSAPVVNYPNEHLYTRVTEFKYLTGQEHAKTSVVYEFPKSQGDAYYPVPRKENADLYARYKARADATPNVHFVGRLATYKYYNMDQIVVFSQPVEGFCVRALDGTMPIFSSNDTTEIKVVTQYSKLDNLFLNPPTIDPSPVFGW